MLETLAIFCLVLWILGLISHFPLGDYLHLFLAAAVVLFAVRLFWARIPSRPRPPS